MTLEENTERTRTIVFWREEGFVGPRLWRSSRLLGSWSLLWMLCWITLDFYRFGRWRLHSRDR